MSLDSPGVYNLHIKLPQKIDPERTDATFNTNSHKLIVKLPIQSWCERLFFTDIMLQTLTC